MDVKMRDVQPLYQTVEVDNESQNLSDLNLEDNTNKVTLSHMDKKSELNKKEEPIDEVSLDPSQDKRYKMIQAMYEETKKMDKFLSEIGYVNPHIPPGTLAQDSLWKGRVAIVLVKAGDKVKLLQDLFVLNIKEKYCKPPIDSDPETESSTLPQSPKVSESVGSKAVSDDEDSSDVYEDEDEDDDEDATDVYKDMDSSDDDKIGQLIRKIKEEAEDEDEDEDEDDSISSGSDTLSTFPSPEKPSASSKAQALLIEDFFESVKGDRKVIWPYVIVHAEQSCLVTKVMVKEGMKVKPMRPLFFYDKLNE